MHIDERVAELPAARARIRAGWPPMLPTFATLVAVAIFRDSMRAFAESDFGLARTLKLRDKELDTLTSDLSEKLVARATADSESVPSYMDLIFVARALERIRDHATNIAEDSFWRDQAADIRHTYGGDELTRVRNCGTPSWFMVPVVQRIEGGFCFPRPATSMLVHSE